MGRADRAQKRYDEIVKGQAAYSEKNAGKLSGVRAALDPDAMRHTGSTRHSRSKEDGDITLRFEASKGAARRGARAAKSIEREVDAQGRRDARNARKKGRGK